MADIDLSAIERVFREEYGRAVAVLVRVLDDIDLAEDAVQDAFTAAVRLWPSSGLPPSPVGWIITTARNRAKSKIRTARIPYRVPDEAELPDRLQAVLAVLYLVFNEGYSASSGDQLIREDLCTEAIRLARMLAGLMPDEPEVLGLLALLLLIESRRRSRTTPDGDIILLANQDRSRWDRALIDEGHAIVRRCLRRKRPGPYQIQAAINAVHSDAPVSGDTDWRQILLLYDQLQAFNPGPIVALNRAVALAEVDGPAVALGVLEALPLGGYSLFHAVRADLPRRLGRTAEALLAYDDALALTTNAAERAFLRRARQGLTPAE